MSEAAPVMPGNASRDDYPRMLYHPDGRTIVVHDASAHDVMHKEGWHQEPLPIHRKAQVSQSPIMSGSDPFAIMIRGVVEAVLDERGLTAGFVQSLVPKAPQEESPMVFPSKNKGGR